jgi:hypothetical protein
MKSRRRATACTPVTERNHEPGAAYADPHGAARAEGPVAATETDAHRHPADGTRAPETSDYPPPRAIHDEALFYWNEDDLTVNNYATLGKRLAAAGDLYRRPGYASGLLLAPKQPNLEPILIDTGKRLAAVIVDRVRVRIVNRGNSKGSWIPSGHLDTALCSEVFLQQFKPIDDVVSVPVYLSDFQVMKRGYNDRGPGQRFLYIGPEVQVEHSLDAMTAFLDVMDFASNADRTNAVGLALTVVLRNFWPGAKPVGVVTSTKSHGGKDTIVSFATGSTPKASLNYESTDWAFRHALVSALKACPNAGVVTVENARLGRGDRYIASACLEQFLTDPEPALHSTKLRDALKIKNQVVVTITTNYGTVSADLMNRALPIHLSPIGNVADRVSPIGNPKLAYLPAHRDRIEAELRGLIERWKEAGRPLDNDVKHPFSGWAATIGGILKVNGFEDFLGNYSLRRTADDPLQKDLGLLGVARPDEWLRADTWARLAVNLGVAKTVIPEHDRHSDKARERGIGVVLSVHKDETFVVVTEDAELTLRLEKKRGRFDGAEPSTRYRFVRLVSTPIPEDSPQDRDGDATT